MNQINQVKEFIDFKNDNLIDVPANIGYYEIECVHNAIGREIVRLEKEKRTEISKQYYEILKDWDKLLLIICSNRINLENIPLSNEYMTIKYRIGV